MEVVEDDKKRLQKIPVEGLYITLLSIESYMLEGRFMELMLINKPRYYRHTIKLYITHVARWNRKISDYLQRNFTWDNVQVENDLIIDLMKFNEYSLMLTKEERRELITLAAEKVKRKTEQYHEDNRG